jgi:hypothetical protein
VTLVPHIGFNPLLLLVVILLLVAMLLLMVCQGRGWVGAPLLVVVCGKVLCSVVCV